MSARSKRLPTCAHPKAAPSPAVSPVKLLPNGSRLWSDDELSTLRLLITVRTGHRRRFDWKSLLRALPGRTETAIRVKAQGLDKGHRGGRAWSDEELTVLRREWGEVGQRTLRKKLPGRSWSAIHTCAMKLDLGRLPQGWESIESAARRTGFNGATIAKIIAWANGCAKVIEAIARAFAELARSCGVTRGSGRPSKSAPEKVPVFDAEAADFGGVRVRLYTTTEKPDVGVVQRRWRLVQPDEIDAAIGRWMATETIRQGATRLGVPYPTLKCRVRAAGWRDGTRIPSRLAPSIYDEIARPEGLQLKDHAARLGLSSQRLSNLLREAGMPVRVGGTQRRLTVAQVDEALERRRRSLRRRAA